MSIPANKRHLLYLTVVIVDFRPTLGKLKTRHADKMYTFVHNLTLRRKAALFLQSIRHK
ncbi:hypothetical protein HMPREF3039_02117 [Akkermansia sp. KLE1798]|nr:hypothetical protein HMPREF3039_02117 [Akkermansia sp. KLE1798]KZA03929.1 hypothetical protein HMPREF1326_02469 [Akkermansia sp. KLE1605]